MNLRKSGRILGVVAAIAMLAVVLQGCGGDDGVSESLHDQVVMERDEAMAAAEAAEEAAEAAQKAAQDAQAAAEIDKESAEAAQKAAQDAQAAADAANEAAEKAEADKATAEAAQKTAEDALKAAEDAAADALTAVQTAASDAATAAQTASGNAATAAQEAMGAVMHLATDQTEAMADMHAAAAKTASDAAMDDAADAQTASDAAAAAMDIAAAIAARDDAVAAQEMAESHGMTAATESAAAKSAAMMELMVDGMKYSVGDSEVMSDAGALSETDADGSKKSTGMIADVTTMGKGSPSVTGEPDDEDTAGIDEYVAPMAATAGRTFDIGKALDSSDDMARLSLVDTYAGKTTVKVYSALVGDDHSTVISTTMETTVTLDEMGTKDDPSDDRTASLQSKGMYYQVDQLDGMANQTGALDDLYTGEKNGVVKGAKAVEVYTYLDTKGTADDTSDDMSHYVVLLDKNVKGDTTTYRYLPVDIHVTIGTGDDAMEKEVKANLPKEMKYTHVNFGVWADLGAAAKNGMQDVDDLGIGFVQNISGEGMTAEMPNNGSAEYMGNWVATVQGKAQDGNGDIMLKNGDATLSADFSKNEVTAMLTDLAKLEGKITGNEFEGDEAPVAVYDAALDSMGKFTGSFKGGFYGDMAAEAAGIFDYTSDKAGAFRGAFGGAK